MSQIRCKMRVVEITLNKTPSGEVEREQIKLSAVTDDTPENAKWSRWTPSASFAITVNNPDAFNTLSKGHEYYVDLTSA